MQAEIGSLTKIETKDSEEFPKFRRVPPSNKTVKFNATNSFQDYEEPGTDPAHVVTTRVLKSGSIHATSTNTRSSSFDHPLNTQEEGTTALLGPKPSPSRGSIALGTQKERLSYTQTRPSSTSAHTQAHGGMSMAPVPASSDEKHRVLLVDSRGGHAKRVGSGVSKDVTAHGMLLTSAGVGCFGKAKTESVCEWFEG